MSLTKYSRFEDMKVWQDAESLANAVFNIFLIEPQNRDFGLRDQINRSSGSIMDNIAEGYERNGNREFIQFLSYSKGSVGETRSQLKRCLNRHYLTQDEFDKLYTDCLEISKQLSGLINYLKKSEMKGSKFS